MIALLTILSGFS